MPKNVVYFDLETQRSFNDVGGASNLSRMGISVGCSFSTRTGQYRVYAEDDLDELVDLLTRADLVVGFNHLHFDYAVLEGYTVLDLGAQTINLDLMADLKDRTGRRLGLDKVASATLGTGKIALGADALVWWREYKSTRNHEPLLKIARYCAYDVKVTKCIHEYGAAHGHVKFDDGSGTPQVVPVHW